MLLVFTGANSTSLDVDLIGERACHQESPRANVEAMRFTFFGRWPATPSPSIRNGTLGMELFTRRF
jgi:hypothetical protein